MINSNAYRLTIELQSDLCPGSGFDYAGVIDSDVCADEYGLPYIPGRRLKGCFRETAEKVLGLDGSTINSLFGIRGDSAARGFRIRNAYLEHYEDLQKTLKIAGHYNPEQVLEQYTSVRAQTRLEDGVAMQDTLRYTRVIDCINEVTGGNVRFAADVFCEEGQYKTLEMIVKATRNIGLHRSRGLGYVHCTLDPDQRNNDEDQDQTKCGRESQVGTADSLPSTKDDELCEISFTLQNMDPLQISNESDDRSLTYIRGANIRGYLAGVWLRMHSDADIGKFERIFLQETIFNNLYPSEGGRIFDPAPLYLRRCKKTKELVNVVANTPREHDEDAGNRPQKIKSGYIRSEYENGEYTYEQIETDMMLQYHHRHRKDLQPDAEKEGKTGTGRSENAQTAEDAQLYTLETIAPGQLFAGSIITPYRNADEILALFKKGTFFVGKSKTAQYGHCVVAGEKPYARKYEPGTVEDAGNRFLAVLVSDALIRGEYGEYTTRREDISKAIVDALSSVCGCSADRINPLSDIEQDEITVNEKTDEAEKKSTASEASEKDKVKVITQYFETRLIYGYNTMWNLKKIPLPAVASGSCMVFTAPKVAHVPSEFYLGENQQEGLGHIRIFPYSEMKYRCTEKKQTEQSERKETAGSFKIEDVPEAGCRLLQELSFRDLQDELLKNAFTDRHIEIGSAALGRAVLMLRESERKAKEEYRKTPKTDALNKEDFQNPEALEKQSRLLKEFNERCDSVKTESTKKALNAFKKKALDRFFETVGSYEWGLSVKRADELLYRYLLTVMTSEKYHQKNTGKEGETA